MAWLPDAVRNTRRETVILGPQFRVLHIMDGKSGWQQELDVPRIYNHRTESGRSASVLLSGGYSARGALTFGPTRN